MGEWLGVGWTGQGAHGSTRDSSKTARAVNSTKRVRRCPCTASTLYSAAGRINPESSFAKRSTSIAFLCCSLGSLCPR